MGSSLGFGSSACDYGSCDPRPIQTRFRFGSSRQALTSPHTANSPDHSSIGTPSRYCLRSNTLRLLVGTRFQFLFHSPPGVLFTFPSRRGHRPERDRFRVRDSPPLRWAVPGGLPLTITFLNSVTDRQICSRASRHPIHNACRLSRGSGLGSSRFARHY